MQRPEYDLKLIGKNLKRLRLARHLTVEEVREYLCLGSVQAVYKYEAGQGLPQADTMFALMELYGAEVRDLTRESGEEKSSPDVFLFRTGKGVMSGQFALKWKESFDKINAM